jgi:hypothetical protein
MVRTTDKASSASIPRSAFAALSKAQSPNTPVVNHAQPVRRDGPVERSITVTIPEVNADRRVIVPMYSGADVVLRSRPTTAVGKGRNAISSSYHKLSSERARGSVCRSSIRRKATPWAAQNT